MNEGSVPVEPDTQGGCGPRIAKELRDLYEKVRLDLQRAEQRLRELCLEFDRALPECALKLRVKWRGRLGRMGSRGASDFQGVYWGVPSLPRGVRWIYRLTRQVIRDECKFIKSSNVFHRFEEERLEISSRRRTLSRAQVKVRNILAGYLEHAVGGGTYLLYLPSTPTSLIVQTGISGLAHKLTHVESQILEAVDLARADLVGAGLAPRVVHSDPSVLPYVYWAAAGDDPSPSVHPTERVMRALRIELSLRAKVREHARVLKDLRRRRDRIMNHVSGIRKTFGQALSLSAADVKEPSRVAASWESEPATAAQVEAIYRLGGVPPENMTKAQARDMQFRLLRRLE